GPDLERPTKDKARQVALRILRHVRQPRKRATLQTQLARLQNTDPSQFRAVSEWLRYKLIDEVLPRERLPAPEGWEGDFLVPVDDVSGFLRWLDQEIRVKDVLLPKTRLGRRAQDHVSPESGRTVRNAYRLASQLGILKALPP